MRVFPKVNLNNNWVCPICGKNNDKEVVLIPVYGTEEGNNMKANQYHLDCINLIEEEFKEGMKIIYQVYEE